MKSSKKYDYYTWRKFEQDCEKIAKWAKRQHFKTIYGIPRGGLIVAVKLSHLLDIPVVLNRQDIMRKTLIVDDIVDTGNTVDRLLYPIGGKMKIASLYVGENAKPQPDFFVRRKKAWIVFPWETDKIARYDKTA